MKVCLTLLLSIIIFNISAQNCQEMNGKWVNELGSVLLIEEVKKSGEIIGEYASSTGVDGKIFPLQGWVNATLENPSEINVSFMVRWKGYGSITSWTGYCLEEEGMASIKTIWNLVRSGKEFPWERIITNSSTFVANQSNGK